MKLNEKFVAAIQFVSSKVNQAPKNLEYSKGNCSALKYHSPEVDAESL